MVYSPATLAFPINDPSFAYRKEILFFALLSATLLVLLRNAWSDSTLSLFLTAATAICVLSHEALIVFYPYLFCALLLGYHNIGRSVRVAVLPAISSVLCFAEVSRFPGTLSDSRAICASLGATLTQPPSGLCGGAIAYLGRDSAYAHAKVLLQLHAENFVHHFALVAVLAMLAPIAMLGRLWQKREKRFAAMCLSVCAAISFAASIPLFWYGTDWTRWTYVHLFCLFLLLLFVLRENRPKRGQLDGWPENRSVRYISIVALVLYLFGWNLSPYTPRIPYGGLVHYAMHQSWNVSAKKT